MNDILSQTVLNTHDFKKLMVLSDKSIHANLNNPKIGTLGEDHIMDLVYKELHRGKSWTKVRKYVKPCKSCVFNALCPPISNYEYAIGQYDLCHMNN
jgi:pseudo-rSAM protein